MRVAFVLVTQEKLDQDIDRSRSRSAFEVVQRHMCKLCGVTWLGYKSAWCLQAELA